MARSINDAELTPSAIDGEMGAKFVKRLMELEAERDAIGKDIKEVYREVKEAGLPAGHVRAYVSDCRKDPDLLQSWRDAHAAFEMALGPFMDTPLGEAALEAASRVVPLQRADIIGKRSRGRPRKMVQEEPFPDNAA